MPVRQGFEREAGAAQICQPIVREFDVQAFGAMDEDLILVRFADLVVDQPAARSDVVTAEGLLGHASGQHDEEVRFRVAVPGKPLTCAVTRGGDSKRTAAVNAEYRAEEFASAETDHAVCSETPGAGNF